jgi:hypothetical protein
MPNGAPRTRSGLAPSPPYVIWNNYITTDYIVRFFFF